MKATFTSKQAAVEKSLNNVGQPLPLIVFMLFFSIISTSLGSYLLAGNFNFPTPSDKSEGEYGYTPSVSFQKAQDGVAVQPTIEWDKTLGGSSHDLLLITIPTPDGGYLLAGTSDSNTSRDKSENRKGGDDYWIVKIDAQGNKVWDKTIGGDDDDLLSSVVLTPEGGYLLAGYSSSDANGDKSENNKGEDDYWIVKVDANGNKIWDKTLGGNESDRLQMAISIPGGGYLLAGSSSSDASGDKSENSKGKASFERDYWIVKIDADGNKIWDKTLGGSESDRLQIAISIPGGGYLLAGSSSSDASGDKSENSRSIGFDDCWIVKIDADGNKIWDKTLGGSELDSFRSVILTHDGGYLLAGHSVSDASGDKSENSKGSFDYWVVKTDAQGNKQWDRTFGGNRNDLLQSAIPTPDKGYLLAGYSNSSASGDKSENNKGEDDYWIIKIDADGNKIWDKTLGGSDVDRSFSVILTPDEGYLLAGHSVSDASGDKSENSKGASDYWIVKLQDQNIPVVTSLVLINAATDQEIRALKDGDVISLAEVDSELLNIRANISGQIDHVDLKLQGPIRHTRTEQVSPYALFGDREGDYEGKALLTGKYTLTVTPYTKDKKGASHAVSFQVVEEAIVVQPTTEWDKTLGGSGFDELNNVISTPDGGYLLAGSSGSNASGDKSENREGSCDEHGNCDYDYWIVKTDAQGNKVWDKTLGGSGFDELYSAISTSDGGYLLGGRSVSDASGDKSENRKGGHDYWIVKTDALGSKVWDRTFGGSSSDFLYSVISTPDGGYLLAGSSHSNVSEDKSEDSKGGADFWIIKIDGNGSKVWDKTLGGSRDDHLRTVTSTPDGGYLLAGDSNSPASRDKSEDSKGGADFWIVKIDAQGNKVWDKTLGSGGGEALSSAISTPDGGYLLGGSPESDASGDKSENSKGEDDYWIIKIDADGNKIWDKTIGGTHHDDLTSAILTPDGGYLLAGSSSSNASGDKSENNKGGDDYWIVKIDAQGNKIWDKTLGGTHHDDLTSVILTPDEGYLLAGHSLSDASGDKSEDSKGELDYWIVKLKDQNTPIVTSFTLMDAATDQEIKELGDGDVINLSEAGSGMLNIRANTSGPIDHVYLKLQGPVRVNRTEREFPYALFGDREGDYEGSALLAGKYTLTVAPYGGIAHTISFEVTEAPEATARQVKVYPVPTSDMINIQYEGVGEEGHIVLLDFRGKMLLHQPLSQQPVEQVDLSGFKKGIYYLRVISAEGVQVFRVAKE